MKRVEVKESGVTEAVKAAGGRKELGQMVGVTRESVRLWLVKGIVPPGKVLDVESKTGVPRQRLNPCIYPS